ncbi:MAG: DUF2314 domain-containing protein [Planctomycetota bacterium]
MDTIYFDEPEMNAAISTARDTFPQFLANWKKLPNDGVSIKIAVPTDSGDAEHIWFNPTRITKDKITGTCGSKPVDVAELNYGEERTYDISKLSDWMIVIGKKCYGGYTIRVLAKQPNFEPPFEFADFHNGD